MTESMDRAKRNKQMTTQLERWLSEAGYKFERKEWSDDRGGHTSIDILNQRTDELVADFVDNYFHGTYVMYVASGCNEDAEKLDEITNKYNTQFNKDSNVIPEAIPQRKITPSQPHYSSKKPGFWDILLGRTEIIQQPQSIGCYDK